MRDIYLIDFENVASEGLSGITYLSEDDQVIIFYSNNSNRLTMKMHILIGKSVCKLNYFEVSVGGKNALDHQISTWLGYLVGTNAAERNYFIVSRDMGYKHVAAFWANNAARPKVRCIENIRAATRLERRDGQRRNTRTEAENAPMENPAEPENTMEPVEPAAAAPQLPTPSIPVTEAPAAPETGSLPEPAMETPVPAEEQTPPEPVAAEALEPAPEVPAEPVELTSEEIPAPEEVSAPEEVPATEEAPAPEEVSAPEVAAVPQEAPAPVEEIAAQEMPAPAQEIAPVETPVPVEAVPSGEAPETEAAEALPEAREAAERPAEPQKERGRSRREGSRNGTRQRRAKRPEAGQNARTPERPQTAPEQKKQEKPASGEQKKQEKPASGDQKLQKGLDQLTVLIAPYPKLKEAALRELIVSGKKQILCNTLRKQLGQEKGLALYNEIKKAAWH